MTYLNPDEVATLLGIAASFDNRKANEEAVVAWRVALTGVSFTDARDAIAAHYAESREWIMPADIKARVRRMRAKRIAEHPPLIPPPGLTDAEELSWMADARQRVGNGEVIDCTAGRELVTGSIRELLAAATPPTTDPRTEEVPQ